MVRPPTLLCLFAIFLGFASCFPDDYNRCGDGFELEGNYCLNTETNGSSDEGPGDAETDFGKIDKDQWIGSACRCEGEDCFMVGVPRLTLGTIIGCDDVPKDWSGTDLACMQSYEGTISWSMYYAQGFCTLFTTGCDGDEDLCSAVEKSAFTPNGDYDTFTSCPENSVMLKIQQTLTTLGLSADMGQKLCAPICDEDADCRLNEYDDVLDEEGQYSCVDKDGVKFCMDARNLPDDYTVEAF